MDLRKFGFSEQELKEIGIAVVALGFVFFYPGVSLFSNLGYEAFAAYIFYVIIVFFAFVPHELAHKFVAMRYRCVARFHLWPSGLKWALVLALITNGNFVIAAPGAVVIYTSYATLWGVHHVRLTRDQNAYVSAAGPLANIVFALAALSIAPMLGSLAGMAYAIGYVSSFLAFFNLLPIPPLDGSKLFVWNRGKYFLLLALAFVVMQLF